MGFLLKLYRFLRREGFVRLLIVVLFLILFGATGASYFEKDLSPLNALWWTLVTLTTVGYGDISPMTWGGRIIGIVLMFFGIGVLGLFTATIAGVFVEKKFKEEKGLIEVKAKGHFIICGWNHRAEEIVNELRSNPDATDKTIVLVADIPSKPIETEDFHFIQGEVTVENLRKANIKEGGTVIILLDDKLDVYARDAKAVLNTLTVESENPDVYTCVELVNSNNIDHCIRARADEIIVGEEYSGKLLCQAAVNHGITTVISEILSRKYGNDLYKITLPDSYEGMSFVEVLSLMKQESNCLIVAIQSLSGDVFQTNPSADYVVKKGDRAVVISDKRPKAF